jgi:RimJ/RimL family protein N-acetyltransferase
MTTPKLTSETLILREIKSNDIFGCYQILSDPITMQQFGGPVLDNDLDRKDMVMRMKIEREQNKSFFWTVTLREEREFIGFVRLFSYNSEYFDLSFSAMGQHINDESFLSEVDRKNGWELDYALLPDYRNRGIMTEAVGLVLNFCSEINLSPIYAKINSIKNRPSERVLVSNSFKRLMPLVYDIEALKGPNANSIIENGEYGMMYVKH